MFKSVNGLCQFVFASENEHYYLESFVRVNLRQYLYIQLKKVGYSTVFFLTNENGKGCELLIPDKKSADLYDSYTVRRTLFDRLWGTNDKNETGKKVKIDDINQFAVRMLRMMNEEKGIAFVFTTESFDLFSSNGDLIRELVDFSRINNEKKHLILNCISTEHTGSLRQLTKENGIFRSILFEKMMEIFRQYKNPQIYDMMQEHMVGQVYNLNELGYADIYAMMSHYLLQNKNLLNQYISGIDEYCFIIYTWYHSRTFREQASELLEQNLFPEICKIGPVLLVDIESNMSENRLLQIEKLRVCLKEKNPDKELCKVLFGYASDSEFGMVEDNYNRSWIQMIDKMLAVNYIEKDTKEILYKTREELKKTRAFRISKDSKDYIEALNRDILEAAENGDWVTVRKGAEALQFGICKWYAQTLESEEVNKDSDTYKCFEMYASIVEASQKLFKMKQLYDEDTSRIEDMKKEYEVLYQDVLDFVNENPQVEEMANQVVAGVLETAPSSVRELVSKQHIVVNCANNAMALGHERSNKHEKIEFLKNAIQKMEITLSGMKQECIAEQIRDFERTSSKVQEMFVKDSELRKQIKDVSIKFEATTEVAQDLFLDDVVPIEIDWEETRENILKL